MSGDTLVYDMSSMSEGTPSIFVKKDYLNILDNQNGSYGGNQSVIDTSQLANSNKYMNYREAYLAVPMVLTASNRLAGAGEVVPLVNPAAPSGASSVDLAFGLKNWFGSIIHSFTLDYNGTTIVQQTPFVNMWNSFRLMTTLSWGDVTTQGAHMGFYPDNPLSWGFLNAAAANANASGLGVCNNRNFNALAAVNGVFNPYEVRNAGFIKRQQFIAFDDAAIAGGATAGQAYSAVFTGPAGATEQYKSFISSKVSAGSTTQASIQYSIMATIHLKHLHSFFQNIPLLKGVFMKMTLTLNQPQISVTTVGTAGGWADATYSINVPSGGISPIMFASREANNGSVGGIVFTTAAKTMDVSLSVGKTSLMTGQPATQGAFTNSIQLYIPAYTFNGPFESAYLANPVKKIAYTDIYQYQVTSVPAGQSFNQLITNGIANIKSVLILPFYTQAANAGLQPYQSPFDPAGAGPTSPLCLLSNFNVVVAGQNMIYNTQRYSYEQFLNQLYGANAVNAGQTDGLTSALFDKLGFEMEYNYYYVNCSRMLPVEEAVPKSVSIIGKNSCAKDIQLIVFVEYGVEVSVDVLSGARV